MVAEPVALGSAAPLDVIIVRKLGVPYQPELAMGAIGEGDVKVDRGVRSCGDPARRPTDRRGRVAGARRFSRLASSNIGSGGRRSRLTGRATVIVDDGIATGATVRAACQVVASRGAARVIVAVPVATREAIRRIRRCAIEVICLQTPARFGAIGLFYDDFSPVEETEVKRILSRPSDRPRTG